MTITLGETGMQFQERFDLLISSGQASEKSVAATRHVVELVENYYGIRLTEELGASLVNHLAITLKKILDQKKLIEAPEQLWEELQDYPEEHALAESIAADLEGRLGMPLTRDEVGFLAVHLCKIRLESGLENNPRRKDSGNP